MLFDPHKLPYIPPEMTTLRHWLNWRYKPVPGKKPTKVPINPHTEGNAATDQPATWGMLADALKCADTKPARYGIGFVFCPPFVGIDLDNCVIDGTPNEYAAGVLKLFENTYAEWSPSGQGVHIICTGVIEKASKSSLREIYTERRFFTVTGEKLPGYPSVVAPCSDEAQAWLTAETSADTGDGAVPAPQFNPSDDTAPPLLLFQNLCDLEPGFRATWERTKKLGGAKADHSDSAYEMSLARQAVEAGWQDQDVYKLLVSWRQYHKLTPKHLKALERTIGKAHVEFQVSEQEKLLEAPDGLTVPIIRERVTTLLGLPIVKLVQMGRDPAAFRVYLKDKPAIGLGNYGQMSLKATWQRIVAEHTGKRFESSPKRWGQMLNLLHGMLEYEESPDTSDAAETQAWVLDYTEKRRGQRSEYEIVRRGEPFEEGNCWYLHLSRFLTHVQINFKGGLTRLELASRLRVLGWEQTEVRRTDEVTGDSVHPKYWMHVE